MRSGRKNVIGKTLCLLCAVLMAWMILAVFPACTIVHLDRGPEITVDADELDGILQKYDEAGYRYEYDGGSVTLSMAHWDSSGASVERAVVEAVLQGFARRYPDIRVNLEIIQSYEDVYGNYISAGTAADVFLVPDGAVFKWAKNLTNLDPYIASSTLLNGLEDIYPSCLTRYQYNALSNTMGSGNQLALPKDVGPYVMYYNKDWFDEKGVPYPSSTEVTSLQDALSMWQSLTKRNAKGEITGYGVAGLPIEGLVWSAGGDFLNSSRTKVPTDAATVAAIKRGYKFMQDSYVTYNVQPPASFTTSLSASNLFSQQKVATVISGRWEVSSFRSLGFNWDVTYVPAFTDAGVDPYENGMYSGSVGYTINSRIDSAKKMAAWKLVEYIASKEGQEILSATGFQIPVYESLALDETLVEKEKAKLPQNYEVFVEAAKKQRYGLWQYRSDVSWKENVYDLPSEKLFAEKESDRITVDTFWTNAVNKAKNYGLA